MDMRAGVIFLIFQITWVSYSAMGLPKTSSGDLVEQVRIEFDQKYRSKIEQAFCNNSAFKDCFQTDKLACSDLFDPVYWTCQRQVVRKPATNIMDITELDFQKLGKCIGIGLSKSYPKGRKLKCNVRPSLL